MYTKNRIISLGYKVILVLLCAYGILLNVGFPAHFSLAAFKYYTIQSNFVCLVFFIAAAVYTAWKWRREGKTGPATLLPHFKGAVTIVITVTLLIYQFVLAETPFSMGEGSGGLGNLLVHLVTPVLVILDWLLFDEKGHYRVIDPVLWCVIPLLYFAYALVAAPLGVTYFDGSRYPYWFINVDTLGLGRVLLNVLILVGLFLVLNYIIFGLDKLMGARRKKVKS